MSSFYENTISFSNETVSSTCCFANLDTVKVSCGRGTSCAASCCALGATLCPSGDCSNDPNTCNIDPQKMEVNSTMERRGEKYLFYKKQLLYTFPFLKTWYKITFSSTMLLFWAIIFGFVMSVASLGNYNS